MKRELKRKKKNTRTENARADSGVFSFLSLSLSFVTQLWCLLLFSHGHGFKVLTRHKTHPTSTTFSLEIRVIGMKDVHSVENEVKEEKYEEYTYLLSKLLGSISDSAENYCAIDNFLLLLLFSIESE